MDDFNESYKNLLIHVPRTAQRNEEVSTNQLQEKRQETVKVCRTQILSSILESPNGYEKYLPDKEGIFNWIMNPKLSVTSDIKVRITQQSGYFLNYLHKHVIEFVDAFLKFEKKEDFKFLIASAVPCLFGFFSSNEHLRLANPFYLNCILKTKPAVGKKIVLPMFHATALYKFLESVVNPFIDTMNSVKGTSKIVSIFRKLIINNIKLLPIHHRAVIETMMAAWGEEEGLNFFIDDFLKETTKKWLKARFINCNDSVVNVIFSELKKDLNEIKHCLYYTRARFETPNLYTVFNDPLRNFLVSSEDFHGLYEIAKLMPSFVRGLKTCTYIDKGPPMSLFLCKLYTHKTNSVDGPRLKPLIFDIEQTVVEKNAEFERFWNNIYHHCATDNIDPIEFIKSRNYPQDFLEYALKKRMQQFEKNAIRFENFMVFELNKNVVNDWLSLCISSVNMALLPRAIAISQKRLLEKGNTMIKTFLLSSKTFCSRKIKQMQYLLIIQNYLPQFTEPIKVDIERIMKRWKNILSHARKNVIQVGVFCTKRSTIKTFYQISSSLNYLNYTPIASQFIEFMRILKIMKLIGDAEQWKEFPLLELVALSNWDDLIYLYIVIRLFAISNPMFCDLMTEEEALLWRDLDQRIKAVTKDEPIISELIEMDLMKVSPVISAEFQP